jgi:CHAT domain-containing protein
LEEEKDGGNLPAAEDEVRTIDRIMKRTAECKALLRSDATLSNVLSSMTTADIIHFATHGTFDPLDLIDGQ